MPQKVIESKRYKLFEKKIQQEQQTTNERSMIFFFLLKLSLRVPSPGAHTCGQTDDDDDDDDDGTIPLPPAFPDRGPPKSPFFDSKRFKIIGDSCAGHVANHRF